MNEELSENVELGTNAEEKNREVYRQPELQQINIKQSAGGGTNITPDGNGFNGFS